MITLTGLQKKARKLESEINLKLLSLETLVAESRCAQHKSKSKNINSYNSSFNSILVKIEELLSELDVVNAKISETVLVEEDNELKSIHSLQRYRQVLDDLRQDFTKIQEIYVVKGESRNMLVLCETVQSSSGLLNEQLETAVNIGEALVSQRYSGRLAGVLRFNCYKCWNLMFLALVTAGCISFMLLYTSR